MKLYNKISDIEKNVEEISGTFMRYSKDNHLSNIRDSGYFRYSRELLFSNRENCTAERFIGLIMSQGSLQAVLKRFPEMIEKDIKEFADTIKSLYSDQSFNIDFCYRMRIGVK